MYVRECVLRFIFLFNIGDNLLSFMLLFWFYKWGSWVIEVVKFVKNYKVVKWRKDLDLC